MTSLETGRGWMTFHRIMNWNVVFLSTNKNPGPNGFTGEFYWIKSLTSILMKLFQKIEEEGAFPNSFYEGSITLLESQIDTIKRKLQTNASYKY